MSPQAAALLAAEPSAGESTVGLGRYIVRAPDKMKA
jgi:hypothetical protein